MKPVGIGQGLVHVGIFHWNCKEIYAMNSSSYLWVVICTPHLYFLAKVASIIGSYLMMMMFITTPARE